MIINADSAQVYGDLTVLSARPSTEEMHGIKHRLFGTWDGATPCSAAEWATAARSQVDETHAQGGIPILVGGTGLYFRILLEGIAPVPPIDPEIRARVRTLAVTDAYAALQQEDPERAALLSPADTTRIARALEVVRSTGRTLGQWQTRRSGGIADRVSLKPAILLPERDWLYERCNLRFAQMLDRGAIPEVEALLARGLDPALPVMRAIGVPEIARHLQGRWSIEEVSERGARATRNYAKRQFTWFRRQPPPHWPRLELNHYSRDDILEILFHS